jgi:hypothetical protein
MSVILSELKLNKFITQPIFKLLMNRNSYEVQEKILDKIYIGPSEKDGQGEIYGYQKEINLNNNNYYIKIGMSIDAHKRVKQEWKAIPLFTMYTPYRKFSERLSHLLLDYCRYNIILPDNTKQIEWFYIENEEDPINIINMVTNISKQYSLNLHQDLKELNGINHVKITKYNSKKN